MTWFKQRSSEIRKLHETILKNANQILDSKIICEVVERLISESHILDGITTRDTRAETISRNVLFITLIATPRESGFKERAGRGISPAL